MAKNKKSSLPIFLATFFVLMISLSSLLFFTWFYFEGSFSKFLDGGQEQDVKGVQSQTQGAQVLQSQSSQRIVDFIYDSSGQRIGKIDSEGDHIYYLAPDLEVVIKKDGTKVWKRYYNFGGKVVAVREGP